MSLFAHAYNMRSKLPITNFGTEITREAFEQHFTKTKETIRFTFNGWDGKSYDGESRNGGVYRTDIEGYEDVKFIKVGKGLHFIDMEDMVLEKATGERHPEAEWLVDVARA